MAATVESATVNKAPTPEHPSPSGFTAVNGRSPPQAAVVEQTKESGQPAEDTIVVARPDQGEKPQNNEPTSEAPEMEREDSRSSAGKRKRSSSVEEDGSPSSSTTSYQSAKRLMGDVNGQSESTPDKVADSRSQPYPPQTSPGAESDARFNGHPNGDVAAAWHRPAQEEDRRLAEALTRESQAMDNQHMNHMNGSPEPRYPLLPTPMPYNDGIPITPTTNLASAQKQRKRVFSNRTKTGCLTCRKRKKKCDERKPKCNNCERGGFDCAGYSKVNPYPKQPSNPKGPQPLQAKNGYPEPGPNMHHQPPPPPPPPARQMSASDYHRQGRYPPQPMSMHEGAAGRPIHVDDENAHQHRTMLPNPQDPMLRNANSFAPPPPPSWGPSEHHRRPSYPGPDHLMRPDFTRQPPPPDFGRDHKKMASPPRHLPPVVQQQPPPPPPPHTPSSSNHYTPRVAAALALQHSNFAHSPPQAHFPPPPPLRTEKEKMLSGLPYCEKDRQLSDDRKHCSAALSRFNKDIDDTSLTDAQKADTFRQLVEPIRLKTHGTHNNPPPIGRVGTGVEVRRNFYCEYGYNISIGDEVDIGPNVTILDSAAVKIGNRVRIGPGVNIYTTDMDHKTPVRPGEKRKLHARPITIEDDAFIGGNVTLLPGVTIGRGATIGAHSVIHSPGAKAMTINYTERKLLVPSLRRT